MKNLKTHVKGIFTLLLSITYSITYAQYCPPTIPNASVGGASMGTSGTGNDVAMHNPYSGDMHVVAFDGTTPGVDWSSPAGSGTITLPSGISDPDIVLDASGSGDFIVVYVDATNSIAFEKHCFTGGTYSLCVGPTVISGINSRSPNIDNSAYNTRVVVTWQEAGTIRAKAGDFTLAGVMYGPTPTISCVAAGNRRPDVAMNGGNDVWFTYLTNNGGGTDLKATYENWSNIQSGAVTPACNVVFTISSTEFLGHPRIAMPANSNNEHEIVVRYTDNSGANNIMGFNFITGWPPVLINQVCPPSTPALNQFANGRPVVSYTEDPSKINVAWMFDDGSNFPSVTGSSLIDVLVQRLDNAGNVINCACVLGLDMNNAGDDQILPSISGKASPFNVFFYGWVDNGTGNVQMKTVGSGAVVLRVASEINLSEVGAFPNPFKDELSIEFSLEELETVNSIKVYNVTGQMIHSFDVSNLNTGANLLTLSKDLPIGLYVINYESTLRNETIKVSKVE